MMSSAGSAALELANFEREIARREDDLANVDRQVISAHPHVPAHLQWSLEIAIERYLNEIDLLCRRLLAGDDPDKDYRDIWHKDLCHMKAKWPDHFEPPNEHPFIERLLAIWDANKSAYNPSTSPSSGSFRDQICTFFEEVFSEFELRRFIVSLDEKLEPRLPGLGLSLSAFVFEAVALLMRENLIRLALQRLEHERPRSRHRVRAFRTQLPNEEKLTGQRPNVDDGQDP